MNPAILTIIILICAVVSFLLEKIPVNMTVMLTLLTLVVTGLVEPKAAISGFASTTIIMLIGVVVSYRITCNNGNQRTLINP